MTRRTAQLSPPLIRRLGDARRTILHAETRDPKILGAICNLFPALDFKGPALRRHMLVQLDEEAHTR